MRLPIIWIIYCKEITEALRDRLTLLVLIGLPLLIYPLAIAMTTVVIKHQATEEDRHMNTVAIWGSGATPLLNWLTSSNNHLTLERWQGIPTALKVELEAGRLQPAARTNLPAAPTGARSGLAFFQFQAPAVAEDAVLQAARTVLASKQADAVLIIWPGFDAALEGQDLGQVSIYYESVIPKSVQASSRLSEQLNQFRRQVLKERQRERSLPEGFIKVLDIRQDDVAPVQKRVNNVIGQFLPFLLILLAVTGAMVSAVDMTAGEKDRATMQTLLCAPVRSFEIVAGKFLAIWSISLVSGVANLVGIGFTIARVTSALRVDLVHVGTLALMGVLLLPATWTIAAWFLAVAALARDVKDAGNFLAGAAVVVMLPMGTMMLPGIELNAWTCCLPLINLALLIRALMIGTAASHLVFLTIISSLAYAALALALAARVFGREQILLGGTISWRGLFRRDRQRPAFPTPSLVLTLFPLSFVALFYVSLALAQQKLQTTMLITEFGVLLLPALTVAIACKFPLVQTFSLRWPYWRSLLGACLIGLTASAAVAGIVSRLAPPPDSALHEMEELFQLGDKPAPLWNLWLVLAVTPALCEETFFRGLMLSGLRRWGAPTAIIITALLFGLLHGSIYRLLPTFLLGLVLGYAVWRSGSLYCSIVIHALNNGLIATLIWSNGGKELQNQSIPWIKTCAVLVLMVIGLALLTGPKARPNAASETTQA